MHGLEAWLQTLARREGYGAVFASVAAPTPLARNRRAMVLKSILGWLRGRVDAEQEPRQGPPPEPPQGARQEPPVEPPSIDPAARQGVRGQLRRRAVRMEIGGFEPPEGPGGSWFGRVNLALPGEEWPTHEGKPMYALAQIDLTQLPFRPPRLDDLEVITVFIDDDLPAGDGPNGDGWCLRAYPDRSALVPLAQVETGSYIKPFPMRPEIIEEDYPKWEDVSIELPPDIDERYYDLFENAEGFKLGGWPFLVQSEIQWAAWGHPAQPEYVFQIDSSDRAGWMWGDSGVGYFGRGTRPGHTDEWAMSWQCY